MKHNKIIYLNVETNTSIINITILTISRIYEIVVLHFRMLKEISSSNSPSLINFNTKKQLKAHITQTLKPPFLFSTL